ncbi:KTSC domain-containing protein [Kitasatospora sp. NPDC097605]|uniref:KTSC domain-containing protein n=1 Tax=Kitasatospora sp. NPDC097605 TaxID=3157226 RepID=UPI00331F6CB3
MQLEPVRSSNLRAVGYDESTELLRIEFLGGDLYEYFEVPEGIYRGLMSARSHGRFFSSTIRGKYSYRRVVRRV